MNAWFSLDLGVAAEYFVYALIGSSDISLLLFIKEHVDMPINPDGMINIGKVTLINVTKFSNINRSCQL